MAIPANTVRVVMSGTMPGGEIWSSGFWTSGATPTTAAAATALADLWWAQLTAADSSGAMTIQLNFYCTAGVSLTAVTVYCYPAGGPTAAVIGVHEGSHAGLISTRTMPNQIATVVSLRTGVAGRSNRGRMYLPANGAPLNSDGQLAASDTSAIATAWGICFSDWNASGDNGTVSVVSQTHSSVRPVSTVVVDSRMDVQRRRANSEAIDGRTTTVVTS